VRTRPEANEPGEVGARADDRARSACEVRVQRLWRCRRLGTRHARDKTLACTATLPRVVPMREALGGVRHDPPRLPSRSRRPKKATRPAGGPRRAWPAILRRNSAWRSIPRPSGARCAAFSSGGNVSSGGSVRGASCRRIPAAGSLPPDPDYAEHVRALVEAVATAGAETTILFEDETELRRFPPLRRMGMPVGKQWSVEVPESNDTFCLYGALDIETGRTIIEAHPKGTSEYTRAFLSQVLDAVEGQVLLAWDRARWHTSQAVEKLISRHDRLATVLWRRCSCPSARWRRTRWKTSGACSKTRSRPTSNGALIP